jgi:LPXTG-motif cell wall-anchored protein
MPEELWAGACLGEEPQPNGNLGREETLVLRRYGWRKTAMLKKVQVSALTTILLVWSALASAQTTPGTPAAPGAGTTTTTTADSGMNWLWIIIVLAIIAGAVWYFMRRRRSGTGL